MTELPIAVIGAGPVGLAAAAHLVSRQLPFVVLEGGTGAGAAIREWGHVRTFSPWRYMIDRAGGALLASTGWRAPNPEGLPLGNELIAEYLVPLAQHHAIAPHLRLNARVVSVGRKDFDKVRTRGRDQQPFEIRLASGETVDARAVIDASGTWSRPNPAGSGGVFAAGERDQLNRISYGIPDVTGALHGRFAGRHVLVVGSGHSAFNVILDLLKLADDNPQTRISWAMRRETLETVWGGGAADALEARGALGQRVKRAYEAGRIRIITPYRIRAVASASDGLRISGAVRDQMVDVDVDELIVSTGFRPDLDMLSEVRLGLDPWLECASALGPLIDPNEHSCGTVRPHGARELAHPERDFYIVGMKSYGRAPTFLLATGYEQVRSVAAMLAGDVAAAERVELELPETGVCSTDGATGGCCESPAIIPVGIATRAAPLIAVAAPSSCCGGPAPQGVEACCVKDADAKAAGEPGCGCS
jgi:thioredoxin reductase